MTWTAPRLGRRVSLLHIHTGVTLKDGDSMLGLEYNEQWKKHNSAGVYGLTGRWRNIVIFTSGGE